MSEAPCSDAEEKPLPLADTESANETSANETPAAGAEDTSPSRWAGLSAKEIYKIKLRQIKEREQERAKQAEIEAQEQAKRQGEEEEEQRRLGKLRQTTMHTETGASSFRQTCTGQLDDTDSQVLSPVDQRGRESTPISPNRPLDRGRSPPREAVAAVVLTDEDRALARCKDREMVAEILGKAERERAERLLRQHSTPPRGSGYMTVPR